MEDYGTMQEYVTGRGLWYGTGRGGRVSKWQIWHHVT